MRIFIVLVAALGLNVTAYAQPVWQINENPFLPPPLVPGYQACYSFFYKYMDCQPGWTNYGQAMCAAVDREYNENLNCPNVFREQARVNANAAAGNPPMMRPVLEIHPPSYFNKSQ